MTGLEQVQSLVGSTAMSPMIDLLEVEVVSASAGEVRMRAHPQHRFGNQLGMMHGGYVATLLDNACGSAAWSVLEVGQTCVTLEIKVTYLRAIPPHTGPLEIVGRVLRRGRQIAYTEAVVRDEQGRDLATATSTLIVQNLGEKAA